MIREYHWKDATVSFRQAYKYLGPQRQNLVLAVSECYENRNYY